MNSVIELIPDVSMSAAASLGAPVEFDRVFPVNMDGIEVPAFLRYCS